MRKPMANRHGLKKRFFFLHQAAEVLQIIRADQVCPHLFQLAGSLTAVPKTGYRTPPEAQIFHRTIPRTAVSKVGLGDKHHAPQRVDAAVAAQRPLGGKRAVKIVLA